MQIKTFEKALEYLNSFIPASTSMKFPGRFGLERSVYFMKELGDPQEKIKVIHIAGTSGKGSTCYLIAGILTSLGLKTGLHLSPFIADFRERFEINNELLYKDRFVKYLNHAIPAIEKTKKKFGMISYFEILSGLAFYIFEKEKVDYAVIETGLGGLVDATNVVTNPNKVSVITPIGHDHMEILGNTLDKIAAQKAGIIHKGNIVICSHQHKLASSVFEKKASDVGSTIIFVEPKHNFNNVEVSTEYTKFDFDLLGFKITDIKLGLLGKHQALNASVALATTLLVSKRDKFDFDIGKIKNFLNKASFKARFEIRKYKNKKIIIDGAHNPQKMKAFISSLTSIFTNQKFTFIVSFKKGKDYTEMLKKIVPYSTEIIVTSFMLDKQDTVSMSEDTKVIEDKLKKLKFKNIMIINNPKEALELAENNGKENIVITGSLYFIGSIYHLLP